MKNNSNDFLVRFRAVRSSSLTRLPKPLSLTENAFHQIRRKRCQQSLNRHCLAFVAFCCILAPKIYPPQKNNNNKTKIEFGHMSLWLVSYGRTFYTNSSIHTPTHHLNQPCRTRKHTPKPWRKGVIYISRLRRCRWLFARWLFAASAFLNVSTYAGSRASGY